MVNKCQGSLPASAAAARGAEDKEINLEGGLGDIYIYLKVNISIEALRL